MYWMEWISYLNRKRPKPGSILDQYQSQTTTPAKRVESEEGREKNTYINAAPSISTTIMRSTVIPTPISMFVLITMISEV